MATRVKKKRIGVSGASNITIEKIEDYLSEFFKEYRNFGNNFKIEEIRINPSPTPKDKNNIKKFKNCFSSNESIHHGYLKWFSYNYITQNAFDILDIELSFEKNVYMPNMIYSQHSSFKQYGRLLRKEEDIGIISRGPFGYTAWKQEADVSCQSGLIVECGDTSPMSLVMPIITQAVTKIIWLPHKATGEDRKKEWSDFETPLKAFIISKEN